MKCKIAHMAYNVSDMEKSIDFYVNKLGFKECFEIRDNDNNPWIRYIKVCDGQFIELFYADSQDIIASYDRPKSYAHLCLEVDDIFETAKELKANSVVIDAEPIQGKDFNWQCWVSDPDKNPIEFMQIHPNSPQANA